MQNVQLIVITGPTATGKSALAVRLAKRLDGEIVSADSMQVYKHMDIGTAKQTSGEMLDIPHHMIDIVSPFDDYSVARYVEDASKCVDDILLRGKQPILVGGTGLYIDSLLAGRTFTTRGNDTQRQQLEAQYDDIGGEAMLRQLREVDIETADKLHANDKKRIVRALESYMTGGKPISQHDAETKTVPPKYSAIKVALTFEDRAVLYARIDRRVDDMISKGLEHEVSSLLEMGVSRKSTAMQAIGYKEIADALGCRMDSGSKYGADGGVNGGSECGVDSGVNGGSNINTAIEKIKMESRRYAKRQLAWLRRDKAVKWIIWDGAPDIEVGTEKLMELLHEKK